MATEARDDAALLEAGYETSNADQVSQAKALVAHCKSRFRYYLDHPYWGPHLRTVLAFLTLLPLWDMISDFIALAEFVNKGCVHVAQHTTFAVVIARPRHAHATSN